LSSTAHMSSAIPKSCKCDLIYIIALADSTPAPVAALQSRRQWARGSAFLRQPVGCFRYNCPDIATIGAMPLQLSKGTHAPERAGHQCVAAGALRRAQTERAGLWVQHVA
jgi:hypothetical protein